jgi:hypothetical protein
MRVCWPEPEPATLPAAAWYVLTHPWEIFVRNWNWKTALLSAAFRAILGLAALAFRGPLGTHGVAQGVGVEFVFRVAVGGLWGSLMQASAGARPLWLTGTCLGVLLPAGLHYLEYLALRAAGSPHTASVMTSSVAFSVVSLLFNWNLIRRGILITGRGAGSLGSDLRRICRTAAGSTGESS